MATIKITNYYPYANNPFPAAGYYRTPYVNWEAIKWNTRYHQIMKAREAREAQFQNQYLPVMDYNNPRQLNSLADALFNEAAVSNMSSEDIKYEIPVVDNVWGAIIDWTKRADKPGRFDIADVVQRVVAPIHLFRTSVVQPVQAGFLNEDKRGLGKLEGFKHAGINILINAGETLDVAANVVKGAILEEEGPWEGIKRGTGIAGYRQNYDYDTGHKTLDIALEIVSDPLNWLSMGTAAFGRAAANKSLKAAKEVTEAYFGEAAEQFNRTLVNVLRTGGSETMEEAIVKATAATLNPLSLAKRAPREMLDIMNNPISRSIFIDNMSEAIRNTTVKNIIETTTRLTNKVNNIDNLIVKSVATTTGTYPLLKGIGFTVDKLNAWRKKITDRVIRENVAANAYSSKHVDQLMLYDGVQTTYAKLDSIGATMPEGSTEYMKELFSNENLNKISVVSDELRKIYNKRVPITSVPKLKPAMDKFIEDYTQLPIDTFKKELDKLATVDKSYAIQRDKIYSIYDRVDAARKELQIRTIKGLSYQQPKEFYARTLRRFPTNPVPLTHSPNEPETLRKLREELDPDIIVRSELAQLIQKRAAKLNEIERLKFIGQEDEYNRRAKQILDNYNPKIANFQEYLRLNQERISKQINVDTNKAVYTIMQPDTSNYKMLTKFFTESKVDVILNDMIAGGKPFMPVTDEATGKISFKQKDAPGSFGYVIEQTRKRGKYYERIEAKKLQSEALTMRLTNEFFDSILTNPKVAKYRNIIMSAALSHQGQKITLYDKNIQDLVAEVMRDIESNTGVLHTAGNALADIFDGGNENIFISEAAPKQVLDEVVSEYEKVYGEITRERIDPRYGLLQRKVIDELPLADGSTLSSKRGGKNVYLTVTTDSLNPKRANILSISWMVDGELNVINTKPVNIDTPEIDDLRALYGERVKDVSDNDLLIHHNKVLRHPDRVDMDTALETFVQAVRKQEWDNPGVPIHVVGHNLDRFDTPMLQMQFIMSEDPSISALRHVYDNFNKADTLQEIYTYLGVEVLPAEVAEVVRRAFNAYFTELQFANRKLVHAVATLFPIPDSSFAMRSYEFLKNSAKYVPERFEKQYETTLARQEMYMNRITRHTEAATEATRILGANMMFMHDPETKALYKMDNTELTFDTVRNISNLVSQSALDPKYAKLRAVWQPESIHRVYPETLKKMTSWTDATVTRGMVEFAEEVMAVHGRLKNLTYWDNDSSREILSKIKESFMDAAIKDHLKGNVPAPYWLQYLANESDKTYSLAYHIATIRVLYERMLRTHPNRLEYVISKYRDGMKYVKPYERFIKPILDGEIFNWKPSYGEETFAFLDYGANGPLDNTLKLINSMATDDKIKDPIGKLVINRELSGLAHTKTYAAMAKQIELLKSYRVFMVSFHPELSLDIYKMYEQGLTPPEMYDILYKRNPEYFTQTAAEMYSDIPSVILPQDIKAGDTAGTEKWTDIREIKNSLYKVQERDEVSYLEQLSNYSIEDLHWELIRANFMITFAASPGKHPGYVIKTEQIVDSFLKRREQLAEAGIMIGHMPREKRIYLYLNYHDERFPEWLGKAKGLLDDDTPIKHLKVVPDPIDNEEFITPAMLTIKNYMMSQLAMEYDNDILGTRGDMLSYQNFKDMEKIIPPDYLRDMVPADVIKAEGLFNMHHFNRTARGNYNSVQQILPKTAPNMIKNLLNTGLGFSTTQTTKASMISLFETPHSGIRGPESVVGNMSDEALYEYIQTFPKKGMILAAFRETSKGEIVMDNLNSVSFKTFQMLRASTASITILTPNDHLAVVRALGSMNKISAEEVSFWTKYIVQPYKRLHGLTKLGYLNSAGFLLRNFVDSFLKNLVSGSSIADIPRFFRITLDSFRMYAEYQNMYNQILDKLDMVFSINKAKALVENKEITGTLSWDAFHFIHSYIEGSFSAGLTGIQQKVIKKQIKERRALNGDRTSALELVSNNPITKLIMGTNSGIEQIHRLSALRMMIDQGSTYAEATDLMRKIHFDQETATKAEHVLDTYFMFAHFKLRNLLFWLEKVSKVGWVSVLLRDILMPIFNFDETDAYELSRNLSLQYHVLMGNIVLPNNMVIKLNPSFMDTFKFITDPSELFSAMSVYFRIPLELLINGVEDMKPEDWKKMFLTNIPMAGPLIYKYYDLPALIDRLMTPYGKAKMQEWAEGQSPTTKAYDRIEGNGVAAGANRMLAALLPSIFGAVNRWDDNDFDYFRRSYTLSPRGSQFPPKIYMRQWNVFPKRTRRSSGRRYTRRPKRYYPRRGYTRRPRRVWHRRAWSRRTFARRSYTRPIYKQNIHKAYFRGTYATQTWANKVWATKSKNIQWVISMAARPHNIRMYGSAYKHASYRPNPAFRKLLSNNVLKNAWKFMR